LIQFKNLSLVRHVKILIEQATFQLHPGHKVGLTGANGTGKSSLFALLRGELHQEVGELELPPNWVVAHVAQEMLALSQSALEFTLDGDAELRDVEAALVAAEAKHEGEKIAELHHRLSDIEGYSARARAAALLDGLGFTQTDLSV
jgi:ATP-binding cassette, subfamily F, member 3